MQECHFLAPLFFNYVNALGLRWTKPFHMFFFVATLSIWRQHRQRSEARTRALPGKYEGMSSVPEILVIKW